MRTASAHIEFAVPYIDAGIRKYGFKPFVQHLFGDGTLQYNLYETASAGTAYHSAAYEVLAGVEYLVYTSIGTSGVKLL